MPDATDTFVSVLIERFGERAYDVAMKQVRAASCSEEGSRQAWQAIADRVAKRKAIDAAQLNESDPSAPSSNADASRL